MPFVGGKLYDAEKIEQEREGKDEPDIDEVIADAHFGYIFGAETIYSEYDETSQGDYLP